MHAQIPLAATRPLALPAGVLGDIQIRLLDLRHCAEALDDALAQLSASEQARYARYHHPADARRFALTRATLRQWLAVHLGQAPQRIDILTGLHGKPRLANDALHFNIAHTGDHALLALSATQAVGVDIEAIAPGRPWRDMARQAFSAQEQALCGDAETFYRIWTAKEAVVKAWGSGITDCLPSLSVIPEGDEFKISNDVTAPQLSRTRALPLSAPSGYAAAMALIQPAADQGAG